MDAFPTAVADVPRGRVQGRGLQELCDGDGASELEDCLAHDPSVSELGTAVRKYSTPRSFVRMKTGSASRETNLPLSIYFSGYNCLRGRALEETGSSSPKTCSVFRMIQWQLHGRTAAVLRRGCNGR